MATRWQKMVDIAADSIIKEDIDAPLLIDFSSSLDDFFEAVFPSMKELSKLKPDASQIDIYTWFLVKGLFNDVKELTDGKKTYGWIDQTTCKAFFDTVCSNYDIAESLLYKAVTGGRLWKWDPDMFKSLSDPELTMLCGVNDFLRACMALRNACKHDALGQISIPRSTQNGRTASVVVLGATGAGKSTLINSLLGEDELLPTSCMRACTATVVEMMYNPAAEGGKPYLAEVVMTGKEAWKEEVSTMLACINEHAIDSAREEAPEDDAAAEASSNLAMRAKEASAKLKSVYGSELDVGSTTVDDLIESPEVKEVLGTIVKLQAATGIELKASTSQYVDSSNHSADGALWPLVQRVALYGPWALLIGGLKLVDAPGTHDDNAARDRIVKDRLDSADVVLLVSNIRRACNDKTVKDWLPFSLRDQLTCNGKLGQVAFAVTQSDVLERSEIVKNLKLPATSTKLEAALARNQFTKQSLAKDFWRGIDKDNLPINSSAQEHEFFFDIPVFTCSAFEHQRYAGARASDVNETIPSVFDNDEQTEVPALARFLNFAVTSTRQSTQTAGSLLLQHERMKGNADDEPEGAINAHAGAQRTTRELQAANQSISTNLPIVQNQPGPSCNNSVPFSVRRHLQDLPRIQESAKALTRAHRTPDTGKTMTASNKRSAPLSDKPPHAPDVVDLAGTAADIRRAAKRTRRDGIQGGGESTAPIVAVDVIDLCDSD